MDRCPVHAPSETRSLPLAPFGHCVTVPREGRVGANTRAPASGSWQTMSTAPGRVRPSPSSRSTPTRAGTGTRSNWPSLMVSTRMVDRGHRRLWDRPRVEAGPSPTRSMPSEPPEKRSEGPSWRRQRLEANELLWQRFLLPGVRRRTRAPTPRANCMTSSSRPTKHCDGACAVRPQSELSSTSLVFANRRALRGGDEDLPVRSQALARIRYPAGPNYYGAGAD